MNAGAYDDLHVVDLSDRLSGAFAARLFGDFGADVVLAEAPTGHPLRHEPPFLDDVPGADRSAVHAYANWNKRSHVVRSPEDVERLVAEADVVVTTAAQSTPELARAFRSLRSDAVHLCVTPHGLAGPLAGRPGNNLTSCARTGWSFINRYRDEPPLQLPRHQTGYIGGVTAFIAGAAALRRRGEGDRAELVDVSETEALALTVHPWGVAAVYEGRGGTDGPAGGRPRGAPGPLWDLADGRMHLAIADFRNWTAALTALGLPELAHHRDLVPDLGRHSADLSAVVAGLARSLPQLGRWDVFHQLTRLRCVVGVLQDIDDLVQDPQLAARGFLVETALAGRPVRAGGPPARMVPSSWRLSRPAPSLDETPGGTVRTRRPQAPPTTAPSRGAPRPAHDDGPLRGLRVLSFGQAWSGTFGTELLALLGADVVQVASLHRPDVWRRVRNEVPAALAGHGRVQHPLNTQGLYNSVNLNKRELTLDLRHERGRELFWQLVPRFDVLADNFRSTVLPAWGVTLERLQALRPGMIWASISGYGADGPYRAYPANGATTEPMAGLSSLHGYEGDAGMNTGGLYPDPVAGYFLAATVLAALAHRDRTGEAQRIDLSMMEAVAVLCGDAIVERDATGRTPRPMGNHHPRIAPHNVYPARDGQWLALAAETAEAWSALVGCIGDPALRDQRFDTMAGRKVAEAQLDAIISRWCADRDASEAEAALCAAGLSAARVVPLYELYERPDPAFAASGFLAPVDHPEVGRTWLPGRPWRYPAAAAPLRPAPCVGQHSREVLVGELGITDAEYAGLVAAGVTGTAHDLHPTSPRERPTSHTEEHT